MSHATAPFRESASHLITPAWGIFSTVDMSASRTEALASLISFGWTCRRIRREVKVVLFRCIRTPTEEWAKNVLDHQHDWAAYVK